MMIGNFVCEASLDAVRFGFGFVYGRTSSPCSFMHTGFGLMRELELSPCRSHGIGPGYLRIVQSLFSLCFL